MFILTQKSRKLIVYHREMFLSLEKYTKTKYSIICHDPKMGCVHRIAINIPLYVARYLMTRILCCLNNIAIDFIDIDEELKGVL